MDYKTLLLQVDERPRRLERVRLALHLAAAFRAHVVARFAFSESPWPLYAAAEAASVALEIDAREREAAALDAKLAFEAEARRAKGVSFEWRDASGDLGSDAGAAARCADLVVAGQPEPGDAVPRVAAGDLLLSAGRPVLFVPYAGRFETVGRTAVVAWNGGRESARAVADALPLLRRAGAVHVLTLGTGPAPAAELGAHLGRHGVAVKLHQEAPGAIEAGEQILSRAADLEADLLVMGGYGHARLRERVLGGATRTLLESMTLPVLMSH